MTRSFFFDQRGVVSVEFALAAIFIVTAMLNAADVGEYVHQSMQVENAAQMGAQTALQTCAATQLPVMTACPGLSGRITSAVTSTSLGGNVTVDGGQAVEAYYCINAANTLVRVGTIGGKPATCAATGNPSVAPGDYVVVTVSFPYTALFPGAGAGAVLTTPIRRSAIMRLG